MILALRACAAAVLGLFFAESVICQSLPWDQPAFGSDPKALIAAAEKVDPGESNRVLLLDEAEYVIAADGSTRTIERMMFRVVSESGVEAVAQVSTTWMPWYHDRPVIEARVVTKDGTVHKLDKGAITEAPAREANLDIFSDNRVLRAPLPAVGVGSVVEFVITSTGNNPIADAGTTVNFSVGGWIPIERTRVIIDAPAALEPRIINTSGIEMVRKESDGRRRLLFEKGRIEATKAVDGYLPYDVTAFPYIAFSTGKSWQDIATRYAEIVDRQIAGSDLKKSVRDAAGKSTDRAEIAARVLAAIQKTIRYAGVEVGEASIVPRTPAQVIANQYGDCKDKATLLVAMLREAGLTAHVALLRAGYDFDVPAELPGLGRFNHAIVVIEGGPAIWVDPTAVFARAGDLPLQDQGRMALIARAGTTTLTRTPESRSTDNLYRERRTFFLTEDGKARVTEVSEPYGHFEASLREWVAGSDAKELRDNLEKYVKGALVAQSLIRHETNDAHDLTAPFLLTVEAGESKSGVVSDGGGAVAINPHALFENLPEVIREWREPQPNDDPDDAPKPRTHDFVFLQPLVREWVYRIVPPAGYVARTLPPSETKRLGTIAFTQEFKTDADGVVTATFRVDSGKRRLTAAEFNETRVAVSKLLARDNVLLGFDQIGQTRLIAGDVAGALAEFRRLAVLHPKEAQHHNEIARALLAGGLGEAARDAARRAVAIEPKSARAHQRLGWVLLHDLLGRQYRRGFDLTGAIAALRKAKELDPQDIAIRSQLASALSYGEDGRRFGPGARLAEAVEEYRALVKDFGDEGKGMEPEIGLLYAHMGRFADMRTLGDSLVNADQRNLAKIVSAAAIDGVPAALRELGAFDPDKRRSYASGVGQLLMQVRLYAQAAALFEASTQGAPNAADTRALVDFIRRVKRMEDLPADDGPGTVMRSIVTAIVNHDENVLAKVLPEEYLLRRDPDDDPLELLSMADTAGGGFDVPLRVMGDFLLSLIQVQQDSDEAGGYRLRMRMLGMDTGDDHPESILVRKENTRWVIRGGSDDDRIAGETILKMVADGQLETARRWLNWLREESKGGSGDDPLDGAAFAAVWPKAKTTATADEIRLAAALMTTHKWAAEGSVPVLLGAREKASDAAKTAIDQALMTIYTNRLEWTKLLPVTERLIATYPDSPTAFQGHVDALIENGRIAEAAKLANQRLERLPRDPDAMRALTACAASSHDYAAAQIHALKIVDDLNPTPNDYTAAAWLALFTGKFVERAIEHAQHASKDDSERKDQAWSLTTLAALYAESGKSLEARDALLQSMDVAGHAEPKSDEWYILGRIAENYGVNDVALAAYRRVDKETAESSVWLLTEKRLDMLGKN